MNGKIQTSYGDITIDQEVIAVYAGSIAVESPGIVGMAAISMKDGLVKLLKRDNLKYGVGISISGDEIELTFHVIVAYGISISTIAESLVSTVKYKVEQFTGMNVRHVNLLVEGVRIID